MAHWKRGFQQLAHFSLLQVLVHAVMAMSGFLLVRALDKSQFAFYTVAASMQALLAALTDSGVGTGVTAIGGRIWQDPERLGRLVSTALRLRLRLALFAVPVTVVAALFLFRQNGVRWVTAIGMTVVVIATLWGTFMAGLYAVPFRLCSLYSVIQKIDLLAGLGRLLLLSLLACLFLNAMLAMMVTLLMILFQGITLRGKAQKILSADKGVDKDQYQTLFGLVRKQFLSTFFFAFQGQITVLVISLFGSVDKIADVGALSRLAIVFAIFGSILAGIVSPTFARCESLKRLVRLFAAALLAYVAFAGVLLACSVMFPDRILWVLGGKYESLTQEVPWLVANSVAAGLVSVVYTLALARGWIWHAWLVPILTLMTQIVLFRSLNVSTVKGVLVFGLLSLTPTFVLACYMTGRGLIASWRSGELAPVAS